MNSTLIIFCVIRNGKDADDELFFKADRLDHKLAKTIYNLILGVSNGIGADAHAGHDKCFLVLHMNF